MARCQQCGNDEDSHQGLCYRCFLINSQRDFRPECLLERAEDAVRSWKGQVEGAVRMVEQLRAENERLREILAKVTFTKMMSEPLTIRLDGQHPLSEIERQSWKQRVNDEVAVVDRLQADNERLRREVAELRAELWKIQKKE